MNQTALIRDAVVEENSNAIFFFSKCRRFPRKNKLCDAVLLPVVAFALPKKRTNPDHIFGRNLLVVCERSRGRCRQRARAPFGAMPKGRYFLVREFWLRQAVQTCFAGLMVRAWRKRRDCGAAEMFRRI